MECYHLFTCFYSSLATLRKPYDKKLLEKANQIYLYLTGLYPQVKRYTELDYITDVLREINHPFLYPGIRSNRDFSKIGHSGILQSGYLYKTVGTLLNSSSVKL